MKSIRLSVACATSLLAIAASGCGDGSDQLFCDSAGCDFSNDEWKRLGTLTGLGPPPVDPSNRFQNSQEAILLGKSFYFDKRFSGPATQIDALRRPASAARAPKGQPTGVSCATCHDLGHGGVDVTSVPGHVSAGAGWTDVNALSTINSAYYPLPFWNGRVDSLWALSVAVAESPTTMNGNRLRTFWIINDNYGARYNLVFAPQVKLGDSRAVASMLETQGAATGQCRLGNDGSCPPPCRRSSDASGCWPRFPLEGKPGAPGCQSGLASEPFGDAFDCMDPADQEVVTRTLVNWAKALAAYQSQLVSRNSPFDGFVRNEPTSAWISPAAKRGARLFVGKAACIDCHNTPLLSDGEFHNVGVPQSGSSVPTLADCPAGGVCDCVAGANCLPWGAFDGQSKLAQNTFRRSSRWSDDQSPASDATEVVPPTTLLKGAWRTPSLRNVALTAPYMHDGAYATLEQVIAHYQRGGSDEAIGTRAADIKPLALTPSEASDLVEFLKSLTGQALPPSLVHP
jgi:cytochrome c peroxidase